MPASVTTSTKPAAHTTILIVEDERPVRGLIASILKKQGYRVLEAANGLEALELVKGDPSCRLVITDVIMPKMNGPELVNRLTAILPEVRVLFISGYLGDALDPEGLPHAFLQKPLTPQDLTKKVAALLSA